MGKASWSAGLGDKPEVVILRQYRIIRQGDLAWNFASQICCENAGILCVFQIFAADL